MKCLLFTVLVWLSLVMGVVSCLMWGRSCLFDEAIALPTDHHLIIIKSQPGRILFYRAIGKTRSSGGSGYESRRYPSDYSPLRNGLYSFKAYRLSGGVDAVVVAVPYWSVLLLSTAAPLVRWRASRRYVAGLCSDCGYDLRATPDRCPECGAVPDAASTGG